MVWMPHWGLSRDPFAEFDSAYVSLPSHDEAIARVVFAIETSRKRAVVAAPSGLGKTTVLRAALAQARNPRRRFATVSCPNDGTLLFALLAERLGQHVGREPGRLAAWRALERAVRLASLQGFQVVMAIDDCDDRLGAATRHDLDSLAHLGSNAGTAVTIIQLERTGGDGRHAVDAGSSLTAGLESLTRSQAERYLATKLVRAGSTERIFTPRAITRVHGLSLGSPRGLEQLAAHCLFTGARRGLEVINPEWVDAVAGECWPASSADRARLEG